MVDHLSAATGGPQRYAGRGMKTAHRGLRITEAQWQASNAVFAAVLDARGVRPRDRDEFLGVIAGLEGEIVGQ